MIKSGEFAIVKKRDILDDIFDIVMVISQKEKMYTILEFDMFNKPYDISSVNEHLLFPLSDKKRICNEIEKNFNKKIEKLKSQIKPTKRCFYEEELVEKYETIKLQIENTCKNLLECSDQISFENKLKAICQKKKELFSIKCDSIEEARKENGTIYYKIRTMEEDKENAILRFENKFKYLVNQKYLKLID